ncbi:hypothetical protein [Glycomyces sp. MUSA5-2]|uniref:hypothetical protein n=1 Tax=Glycomyces sp. MUSA5-2 TaxID=2053002 RepID=UPI00300A824E
MDFNNPDTIANLKGETVRIVLTTGDTVTGTFKGANAKGVRIVPEGKTNETSRVWSRVADIHVLSEAADNGEEVEDTRTERDYESEVAAFFTEDVLNADVESEDGNPDRGDMDEDMTVPDDASELTAEAPALPGAVSTPAQLAVIFGVSAFQIRQALRSLGLNVGRGKKYDLSDLTTTQLTTIREAVKAK